MAEKDHHLEITPETRVGALLDRYPQLEKVLLETSPAFSKLKNPVLRRTVAKVATLRQIALVGRVPLGKLINDLRAASGLKPDYQAEIDSGDSEAAPPAWFRPSAVTGRFDARDMIERGEQPLGRIQGDLRILGEGQIYELTTPFVPAPVIDLAAEKGFASWTVREGDTCVKTYFSRVGTNQQ